MIQLRKNGYSYPKIMDQLHVSKWQCMNYLKDIEVEEEWVTQEWKRVEDEAEGILADMGFTHIVNLNRICNVAPHWDYYAWKKDGGWLVDVTINTQKSIMEKQVRGYDGFNLAILYKDSEEWRLLRLSTETIATKPARQDAVR